MSGRAHIRDLKKGMCVEYGDNYSMSTGTVLEDAHPHEGGVGVNIQSDEGGQDWLWIAAGYELYMDDIYILESHSH